MGAEILGSTCAFGPVTPLLFVPKSKLENPGWEF